MLKKLMLIMVILMLPFVTNFAQKAAIGKAAPDFELTDSNGDSHKLSDFKGKLVVLEWVNYDCPFVKKHYDSGNMQNLQKKYTAKDVVWLSICSSAEGKQGNYSPEVINKRAKSAGASFTAYLTDADGKVGKMYGAKTTPHMYVIDTKGTLAYVGAIDDIRSTNPEDAAKANNYVASALDALMEGKKVETSVTKSYGCGVKYK